ncbi:MAG TPA: FecR family protein [Bryobacteraceae bacterium]|nr:FecR family protein [Bryobacteraceae bacterium]
MTYYRLAYFGLMAALALPAQDVISAKPGLIHYTEGAVTLGGKPVELKAGEYPEVKKGQELATDAGRVEVLLSPGVFLRLAENSSARLVANALEDVKIELLRGSMLLEVGEFDRKFNNLSVTAGDAAIEVVNRGLVRIDREPALLKVYEGSVAVVAGGQPLTIKEGRQTLLSGVLAPERFNKDGNDAFHRWAARRSSYIALANIQAAKRVSDNSVPWRVNNWIYNPYFGSFTYMPARGMYRNPFGYSFYSPVTVGRVYYRPPAPVFSNPSDSGWSPGLGTRSYGDYSGRSTMGTYSAGGGSAAPAPAAAAPPPSSGASRSGGAGEGRSAGSGR